MRGAQGDAANFTIEAIRTASVTSQMVGDPVDDLLFGGLQTSTEAVSAAYTVAVSGDGSTTFTSEVNRIEVEGVEVQLEGIGASTFGVTTQIASAGFGVLGNMGTAAAGIVRTETFQLIDLPDAAFALQSTGGDAGQARTGGTSETSGTGGATEIDIDLGRVQAATGVTARSDGGQGGQGGTGGQGFIGGTGGAVDVVNEQVLRTTGASNATAILGANLGEIGGQGGTAGGIGSAGAGLRLGDVM